LPRQLPSLRVTWSPREIMVAMPRERMRVSTL